MAGYEFLTWDDLLIAHLDQLSRYGGQDGFIDENVVRAALSRPQFKAQYDEEADVADLAAAYLFALCTTQGFLDGNKRTAVVAADVFLQKNGFELTITQELLFVTTLAVISSQVDEETLARIIRDHIATIEEP